MKKTILVEIEESNPMFPVIEYMSKQKWCSYVDSITSERIDGIAKIIVKEGRLEEFLKEIPSSTFHVIEKSYNFRRKEKGILPFWIKLKIYKENLKDFENFMERTKNITEAYLTPEYNLFMRGYANLPQEIDFIWTKLFEENKDGIDLKERTITYIVLKTFKK
ncbi:MAG: hypothetical protein QXX38_00525 [Candidatus Aenigmatarchaeota archaeon]